MKTISTRSVLVPFTWTVVRVSAWQVQGRHGRKNKLSLGTGVSHGGATRARDTVPNANSGKYLSHTTFASSWRGVADGGGFCFNIKMKSASISLINLKWWRWGVPWWRWNVPVFLSFKWWRHFLMKMKCASISLINSKWWRHSQIAVQTQTVFRMTKYACGPLNSRSSPHPLT